MRLSWVPSWQVSIQTYPMVDCALWIRATERLDVPDDPLVPGPLDVDRPPPPISTGDDGLAQQWLGWWHSLVAPTRQIRPPDPTAEPAYDSPDPIGLAPYPALAAIAKQHFPQVARWQATRPRLGGRYDLTPSRTVCEVVQEVEQAVGRKVRPFAADVVVLPVRDDVIRPVDDDRYLVPEQVCHGPGWAGWVRDLVTRVGL